MRAERALHENQRVLSTLLANLSGMAYRCRNDEHWTMEFVGEGCRELTEYPPSHLLGNREISYEEIIHPEDRAHVRREVDIAMSQGRRFELTYRIVTATGAIRWVIEHGLAVRSQGKSVDFIEGIITDITAGKCAELALAEKERTLSAILDHSFQFIGLLDRQGRLLRANQTSLDAIDARREDVEGRLFVDTPWWSHSRVEQGRLRDAVRRAAAGELVRFETSHLSKDGRLLHIDFSLKPVRDESGRVILMIPEGRDITDRKASEAALRLSEEKFHRAFESSPNFIVISRVSDGLVLDVNEAFSREYHIPIADARGQTAMELGIWANAEERERLLDEFRKHGRVRDYLKKRTLPDGRCRIALLSVEPIQIQGEPCLLSTSIDITAKTKAEQALRESEEKFATAFRASPYSLTISEMATGRYIDVNAGFEQLSGYGRDEVLGRTSGELGLWLNPADRDELVRRLGATGTVRGVELSFRTKDGRTVITLCNCERIELTGRSCLLNVIEDITDRRRTEKEKSMLEAQLRQNQKLESLGTLAGGIAHDFNNILTAIMVNQELALMDLNKPEDLRLRLTEIGRASNRAKELVRQILTFSRQQPYRRERQALQPIVKEALNLVRASLPATIEVVLELSEDAPQSRVDATQIHQVVMNLCTNAAYAMQEKQGRLAVRLVSQSLNDAEVGLYPGLRPGCYARLSVSDTGHGMDAAVLARIFEPFFTTKGPGEGTGLGLAVVHGIMKDYEGGIYVQSRPGEGCMFDLFFPGAGAEEAAGLSAARSKIEPGNGESLLVVDDEPAICEVIAVMLRKIGYQVEKFTDPLMAWERFQGNPEAFDLLLTDLTMPRLTGRVLIAQVQRLRPGFPALLLSGGGRAPGEKKTEGIAVYAEVPKPPDMASLSFAVRRALSAGHSL